MKRKVTVQIWQTENIERMFKEVNHQVHLHEEGYKMVYELSFVTYNDNYMLSLPEFVVDMFNNKTPSNYTGRSISVSDLIHFEEGPDAAWMAINNDGPTFCWVSTR